MKRIIPIKPVVKELRPTKRAALPAFHAGNTESFVGQRKLTWWKVFERASDNICQSLLSLSVTDDGPPAEVFESFEALICQLYLPNTSITKVYDLRWWLFKKKQVQSEKLPPSPDALREGILRAHYQMLIWNKDTVLTQHCHHLQDMNGRRKGRSGFHL